MGGGPRAAGDAPPMASGLAVVTLVKGLIGAGLLGLPAAFGKVGLVVAAPGCVVIAVLSVMGVMRLIETKLTLDRKKTESETDEDSDNSSSEFVEDTNDYGLGLVAVSGRKLFGRVGVYVAAVTVLGTQLGIGLAYIVFIHVTLMKTEWVENQKEVLVRVVCCVIYCVLAQLRKLNSLAILSLLALAAYSVIMIDLMYRGWGPIGQSTNISPKEAFLDVKPQGLESWFGSTVFAFEGIVLAQYVFEDMKVDTARKFMPVLGTGYAISCVVFVFAGVYGYLAYGDTALVPIYLNFPAGAVDTTLDEVLIVLILMVSLALQMYPVFSFVDNALIGQGHPGEDIHSDSSSSEDNAPWQVVHHTRGKVLLDTIARTLIMVLLCILAAFLPKPGCVTDLVGDLFMSNMAFVLPGALHLAAHRGSLRVWDVIMDLVLIVLGCTAAVLGIIGAPACFAA